MCTHADARIMARARSRAHTNTPRTRAPHRSCDGPQFDQVKFDELKGDDGCVTMKKLMDYSEERENLSHQDVMEMFSRCARGLGTTGPVFASPTIEHHG